MKSMKPLPKLGARAARGSWASWGLLTNTLMVYGPGESPSSPLEFHSLNMGDPSASDTVRLQGATPDFSLYFRDSQ